MQKTRRTVRRRRVEGKTDYKARIALLKSHKPRAVVRKTNRYVIGQFVVSDVAQDRVVVGAHSKELLDKGWPQELRGSLKSIAACYLTGYLLGTKSKDIKEVVFDVGLQRNIKRSRLYAFLKGLVDAGITVPHAKEVLPTDEEIRANIKTASIIDTVREKITKQ